MEIEMGYFESDENENDIKMIEEYFWLYGGNDTDFWNRRRIYEFYF